MRFFKDSNSKNVGKQTYKQQTQIDTNRNLSFHKNPAGIGRNLLSMSKRRVLVCLKIVTFSLI